MSSSLILFSILHCLLWASTNYQFLKSSNEKTALIICIILAIPISITAFFASRYVYAETHSAWSVKLFGFGIGYIVFPVLTWIFLKESPFVEKTIISVILAFIIIGVQLFYPNNLKLCRTDLVENPQMGWFSSFIRYGLFT